MKVLSRADFTAVEVPADGSCLYWAVSLGYLIPVKNDPELFVERFTQLFGPHPSSDLDRVSQLRTLLLSWNILEKITRSSKIHMFMKTLVNKYLRENVINEMYLHENKYRHFITLNSLCECRNDNFITMGKFQTKFIEKFGSDIETRGIDVSKLKPDWVGSNDIADMEVEMDKIVEQDTVAHFRFQMYLESMSQSTSWAGQPEIQAVSQVLGCNVQVLRESSTAPSVNFFGGDTWIHLIHCQGNHYNFGLVRASSLLSDLKVTKTRDGCVRHIERCLSLGVDDVTYANMEGLTMMHYAAMMSDDVLARLLVKHGASVRVKNMQNLTPVDLARRGNDREFIQFLVQQQELQTAIEIADETSSELATSQNKVVDELEPDWLCAMETAKEQAGVQSKVTQTSLGLNVNVAATSQGTDTKRQLHQLLLERNVLQQQLAQGLEHNGGRKLADKEKDHDFINSFQRNRFPDLPRTEYQKFSRVDTKPGRNFQIKLLALLFMRGLNYTEVFQIGSNMAAAGRFGDVVFHFIPHGGQEWRTSFVALHHDQDVESRRQSAESATKYPTCSDHEELHLQRYYDAYSEITKTVIRSGAFQFCDNFSTIDFMIFTYAMLERNFQYLQHVKERSLLLLSAEERHLALSFCTDMEIALCELIRFKYFLRTIGDASKDQITTSIEKFVTKIVTTGKIVEEKCTELRLCPTNIKVNEILSSLSSPLDVSTYRDFCRTLTISSQLSNDNYLDLLVGQEIQICLQIDDGFIVSEVREKVFTEIELWHKNETQFLNSSVPFWEMIVSSKIEECSARLVLEVKKLEVKFQHSTLRHLSYHIPESGLMNIIVSQRGSSFLTFCKLYETFQEYDQRNHIFVNMSDLKQRQREILKAWMNKTCRSLVVHCEPSTTLPEVKELCCEIHKHISNARTQLRAIFVTQSHLNLTGTRMGCTLNFEDHCDNVYWDDLSAETQNRIISRGVIFQGHEIPLCSLVDARQYAVVMTQLHGDTLAKLLTSESPEKLGSLLKNNNENFVLLRLRRKDYSFPVSRVSDVPDHIVLLAAEPGMGKSTLLNQLAVTAKTDSPSTWIAVVNLKDNESFLKDLEMDSICEQTVVRLITKSCVDSETGTELERSILKHCLMTSGNIMIFIDSFDDVSLFCQEKTLLILQYLLSFKMVQLWVSSRLTNREKLENSLCVTSYSLERFTKLDQIEFLMKYCQTKVPNIENSILKIFTEKVIRLSNEAFGDEDLFCVPQNTFLLIDSFENYLHTFRMTNNLTIPTKINVLLLCGSLISSKWNNYCRENNKEDSKIYRDIVNIEYFKASYLVRHRNAALQSLLSAEELDFLGINDLNTDWFFNTIGDPRFDNRIAEEIVNSQPKLEQNIFTHFFVATWFVENCEWCIEFLQRNLFESGYEVIKEVFDWCFIKDSELHIAVMHQDLNEVKLILSRVNVDVDITDDGGRTPLHIAACYSGKNVSPSSNSLLIINALLEKGASVDTRDSIFSWQPIEYADKVEAWLTARVIMQKHGHQVEMPQAKQKMLPSVYSAFLNFLYFSTEICMVDLLHASAQYGDLNMLKFIIGLGADVNALDNDGQTALLVASRESRVEAVKYLVASGAELNVLDKESWSCLTFASDNGAFPLVDFLRNSGAQLRGSSYTDMMTHKNAELICASYIGDLNQVVRQIELGADVDATNKTFWSPLMTSTIQGHLNVSEYLISQGAKLSLCWDINEISKQKTASLLCAALIGNNNVIKHLLNDDGKVNAKSATGWNPLMLAMKQNNIDTVKLLLTYGANVDVTECSHLAQDQKDAALMCWAYQGDAGAVRAALECGANPTARNSQAWDSVMLASDAGCLGVLEIFSDRRVNTTTPRSQDTLSHLNARLLWAASRGSLPDMTHIIDLGAQVNTANRTGWNSTTLASYYGNLDCLQYLVDKAGTISPYTDNNVPLRNATLMFASYKGNIKMMDDFVKLGVDVNFTTKRGWTPILVTALQGNLKEMEFLVSHGANICENVVVFPHLIDMTLICASILGDIEVFSNLISRGANANEINNKGWTSRMYAKLFKRDEILSYLSKIEKSVINEKNQIQNLCYLEGQSESCLGVESELLEASFLNQAKVDPAECTTIESLQNSKALEHERVSQPDTVTLEVNYDKVNIIPSEKNFGAKMNNLWTLEISHEFSFKSKKEIDEENNSLTPEPHGILQSEPEGHESTNHFLENLELSHRPTQLSQSDYDFNEYSESSIPFDTYVYSPKRLLENDEGHREITEPLVHAKDSGRERAFDDKNGIYVNWQSPVFDTSLLETAVLVSSETSANCSNELSPTTIPLHVAVFGNNQQTVNDNNVPTPAMSMDHIGAASKEANPLSGSSSLDHDAKRDDLISRDLDYPMDKISESADKSQEIYEKTICHTDNGSVDISSQSKPAQHREDEIILLAAAESGDITEVRQLLRNGTNIEAVDESGSSALHKSAQNGKLDVIGCLLSRGADVNRCNKKGVTPIMSAVSAEMWESVRLLINHGTSTDLSVTDHRGRTLLSITVSKPSVCIDIVRKLVERGADVNETDISGRTPLMRAAASYDDALDIVRYLTNHGANIHARSKDGRTVFHYFINRFVPNTAVLRFFLDNGVDINARNKKLRTPLIFAASLGSLIGVRFLLRNGADPNLRDFKGKSALDFVKKEHLNSSAIASLLSPNTSITNTKQAHPQS